MDKQTVGGSNNGILSRGNGRIIATHDEMDESYKHNVEAEKVDIKKCLRL